MKLDIACNHLFLAPVDQLGVGGSTAAPTPVSPVDMRRSTREISNSFVSESSSGHTYIPRLILFILWLFDNHQDIINPIFLPEMAKLDDTDSHNYRTVLARRHRSSGTAAPTNKRTNLRNYIKACIENTPPNEGQQGHNSPIKIEGEGSLNHIIVLEYMNLNQNEVLVDREAAEQYNKAAGKDVTITEEMVNNEGKVKCLVYQSGSQYSGTRSALAYLYKLACVPTPEKMAREVAKFLQGMERCILSAKQKLGLKISEGKKALSFKAYSMLAKKLFESGAKEDIFAHLFLVLDWCLMKRAENCTNARINHISFSDDCLVFEFAKSKGHQKGEEHVGPWHVYSNPQMPWLCPILALAMYLLCYPDVLKGDVPLFPGTEKSVYNRYADRFNKLVKQMKKPLAKLGFAPGDLATHSARKGVGTMVAAGCTVSPPIVSLCIRAGWTLGGVKDKYLFRENAGDQYVGRCASCLDQNTKEFAVSPAYFDYTKFDDAEKIAKKKRVQNFIDSRLGFPEGEIKPSAVLLIEHCFAAVCYHYSDLTEKYLHSKSILRVASLFRNIPADIAKLAVVKYPWNKTEDTPKATGIPPHVLQLVESEKIRNQLEKLQTSLMTEFKREMDIRGFCDKEQNTTKIMELIKSVTLSQTEAIVKRLIETTNISAKASSDAAAKSISEYQDF
ncbi:hypothetical protein ACHAXR_003117, partial [Thalassiosira sp. AJA248-18]